MTISNFVAYVKQAWKNKPDTSTPLSAPRLLHMEDGIKMTSDAIEKIAEAVVSQIVNDPDKIASMAALYAVDQKIGNVANLPNGAADVVTAIAQQNSNIGQIKLYSETMELNTSGYVDLPISDYERYKSDGYTGYVIMGYVFATGTMSNAIHNVVQSNGVVRINYANSTPGSQTVRACILWRK